MKKRFLRRATALAMATAMVAGSATTAFAGQWKQDATGYWWDENGTYPKNEWKWIDGNGDGVSESYYFGADGYLLTNTTTPDGYTVNADGQWVENGVVKTQGTAKSSGNSGNSGTSAKSNAKQSSLVSYMKNVDKLENTSKANPVGTGVIFPKADMIPAGENLWWDNTSGGTDYILSYSGPRGDYKSAGYTDKMYMNAQTYPTFDSWTTPAGITIDYLGRVLDENGKIRTATAEELGLSYEGGKIRDVAYDASVPLKRVVDLYALNMTGLGDSLTSAANSPYGLREHNLYLLSEAYVISKLTGQANPIHDDSWYSDEERTKYNAVIDVLKNWLNSFDFEHASEMERAKKMKELIGQASYDYDALEQKNSVLGDATYNIFVKKKGVCQDFAEAAHLASTLVGLKCAVTGSSQSNHVMYVIQVDGVPHGGDNGELNLDMDWREESKLGTRESYNYHFGEYIRYE